VTHIALCYRIKKCEAGEDVMNAGIMCIIMLIDYTIKCTTMNSGMTDEQTCNKTDYKFPNSWNENRLVGID